MLNQEILDYIKNQRAAGASNEQIAQALKESGWPEADIESALNGQTPPVAPTVIPSQKLPPAKEILKEAWQIYKDRFWVLISISIVPTLSMFILGALMAGGAVFLGIKINTSALNTLGIWIVLFIILLIAVIYISIWSSAAGLIAIKDHQEQIGFTESFKRSKKFIGPLFITGLLVGLAVFGGLILLIIPGILFMLWFSQSMYIVINEGISGTAALSKSKTYVTNRIGEIFSKYLYILLIMIAASIIVGILDSILFNNSVIDTKQSFGLSNILSIALGPLGVVYYFLVYKHLTSPK